ncbi:MAG TPA: hypothetical protein VKB78_13645, partial [Pirellulales bacterium]|nr:hypothetical protein [Pirellulales bacterium]
YGFSRPSVFSTGPIAQHANDDNGAHPTSGTPTPAGETIGPGRPTEALPDMDQPAKSQPSDMKPSGDKSSGGTTNRAPTSIQKRSPADVPSLGSADGADEGAAVRTAWTSGVPNRLPESVESSATPQPPLQWKAAGTSGGDSGAASADGSNSGSGWRAKK